MSSLPPGVVELVPDRLYGLGGVVKNEGRVSYVAEDRGYLPINSYLLREGDSVVLVDTGAACHRDQLIGQLNGLLEPADDLSVFMTRPEAECIGNLDLVLASFGARHVYGGGTLNPFDFIDDVLDHMIEEASDEDTVAALTGRQLERQMDGESLEFGGGRRLHVFAAPLRILTTFWLYDDGTRTLFCSDFFSHNMIGRAGDPQVVGASFPAGLNNGSIESIRNHLYTKFEWLAVSRTDPVKEQVKAFFDGLELQFVAPSYGCVVAGRSTIHQQLGNIYSILSEA